MGLATGAGAFNDSKVSDTSIKAYQNIVSTQLNNNSLITTVKNLVSKTISNTLISNKSSIENIINTSNSIFLVASNNCTNTGGYTVTNITQNIKIESSDTIDSISTMMVNICSTVNNNINDNLKNITQDSNDKTNTKKIGSTFAGVANAAAGKLSDVVTDVGDVVGGSGACAGAFNKCSTNDTKISDTSLQNKYGLTNDFSVASAINQANLTSSDIKKEDIDMIITSITGANSLLFKNVCPTNITFTNIDQFININSLSSNTKISNLSLQIATNYINKAESIIKNMTDHKADDITSKTAGDISDLGDAVAAVIKSGGDAVAKTVDATGKAGTQVIETAATAASGAVESVGAAIASFFSSTVILWVAIAIGLIVFVIIVVNIFFKKAGSLVGLDDTSPSVNLTSTQLASKGASKLLKYFYKSI